jgi:hypothetical protein
MPEIAIDFKKGMGSVLTFTLLASFRQPNELVIYDFNLTVGAFVIVELAVAIDASQTQSCCY